MAEKRNIEVISRALILINNKILLCKLKGKNWFFLPGGHVKFGESVKDTLSREIKEEVGIPLKKLSFIGGIENIYRENRRRHHEINLIFATQVKKINFKSKERHIEFALKDLRSLKKEKILPKSLKHAMMKWLKNKKTFWRDMNEK